MPLLEVSLHRDRDVKSRSLIDCAGLAFHHKRFLIENNLLFSFLYMLTFQFFLKCPLILTLI